MVTQIKSVMNGVVYIDGGWQTIIDQLHNRAVMSGINIQTHRLVKEIHPLERENFQLTLANEKKIYSRYVLSTVGPKELYQMFIKNKPFLRLKHLILYSLSILTSKRLKIKKLTSVKS